MLREAGEADAVTVRVSTKAAMEAEPEPRDTAPHARASTHGRT